MGIPFFSRLSGVMPPVSPKKKFFFFSPNFVLSMSRSVGVAGLFFINGLVCFFFGIFTGVDTFFFWATPTERGCDWAHIGMDMLVIDEGVDHIFFCLRSALGGFWLGPVMELLVAILG